MRHFNSRSRVSSFESQWPLCIFLPLYAYVLHPETFLQKPGKSDRTFGEGKDQSFMAQTWNPGHAKSTHQLWACALQLQPKHALFSSEWGISADTTDGLSVSVFQPRSERAVCHSLVRHLLICQGYCYKWLFFTFGFLQLSFPFRLTHTFTCVVTCRFSLSPCPDCWPVWFFN